MITITKNQQHFIDLKWILSARDVKPKYKLYFAWLIVDNDYLVCTDAFRLHAIKSKDQTAISKGYYEVIKNTSLEIILNLLENPKYEYPKYQQVIPEEKEENYIATVQYSEEYQLSRIVAEIYSNEKYKQLGFLNLKYLEDALKIKQKLSYNYESFKMFWDCNVSDYAKIPKACLLKSEISDKIVVINPRKMGTNFFEK